MKHILAHPTAATAIALLALLAQLATWTASQLYKNERVRVEGQLSVERRLSTLEGKMDQLLGVTKLALHLARDNAARERNLR